MAKEVLPAMMSRRMKFNLTDKSSEVSQKVQQVLKKHLGSIDGAASCKVKGGKVDGAYKLNSKGTVTGFISLEVVLKVTDEGKAAATFGGELESQDEKALKTVKLDCIKYIGTARKELDSFLQDFNQIDNPEEEATGPAPTDLTDASWKKFKNKTLTETGMGKALRDWEAARKECDETATRNLKAFTTADEAIKSLALVVGKTREAASSTFHKSTLSALKAYPGLVKAAREKLQQDQQGYTSFIESWKTSCVNSVEAHKLFDLEVRGLISNGAASAISACNKTKNSQKESERKESVNAADMILKELDRVQKLADQKFKDTVSLYRKEMGPHADDRPKEATVALQSLKKLQENLTNLHKAAAEKLEKAKQENQEKKK